MDRLSRMNGTRRAPAASSPRVSRPVRTLRGFLGATVATLFAAASHALAGGDISGLGIVVTGILALPLCVLLAGRIASLWRLTLAVGAAQFLYHWAFAGLGAASVSGASAETGPVSPHAAHLAAMQSFTPDGLGASPDAVMWLSHALAAAVTVALLYRGERAGLALLRIFSRAVPLVVGSLRMPTPARPRLTLISIPSAAMRLRDRLLTAAAITHRGPPLSV